MPFQLEPVLAYVRGDATRILIADAVGLGKTIQAGLMVAEMLERRRDGRALIVVPGGLREQWRDELRDRFGVEAEVFDAAGLWRASSSLPVGLNPWTVPHVVITSIDFVKRAEVLRSLEPLVWDLVVFDEAHALCGWSDRRLAASGLAVRGRAVVLLTATPHSGDQEAFARLCSLGDIERRFPLTCYRRTRADLGDTRTRRSRWLRLPASQRESALHDSLVEYARRVWTEARTPGARLAMLVLLKRGASSATALARSLARRKELLSTGPTEDPDVQLLLPLNFEDDAEPCQELGAPGLADRERELQTLDRLIALAQSPSGVTRKLAMLRVLFRRTSEPAIVFTQYRDTLDELATAFGDLSVASIHGGMSARERHEAARVFTRGSVRVLLATDAASEGLNLQARCRLVVSFDLPWTPLRLEQRVGRVDRIGQSRRVHAWQMVAGGTYEDVVAERVRARAATAGAAVDRLEAEDERDTAAIVLVGVTAAGALRPGPPHIVLRSSTTRDVANAEARRVITARALARRASAAASARPFFAVLSKRGHRVVFAYQISIADPQALHTWEAIVGGVCDAVNQGVGIERWLCSPEAQQHMLQALGARFDNDVGRWRRSAAAVLRRDRAIGRLLRSERARLSTVLVQRGLFSNPAERVLTPQLQLLDQSVAELRCASLDTRAVGRTRLESVSPLFAAVMP
jgi:superfamily II DNA or RNA helicase